MEERSQLRVEPTVSEAQVQPNEGSDPQLEAEPTTSEQPPVELDLKGVDAQTRNRYQSTVSEELEEQPSPTPSPIPLPFELPFESPSPTPGRPVYNWKPYVNPYKDPTGQEPTLRNFLDMLEESLPLEHREARDRFLEREDARIRRSIEQTHEIFTFGRVLYTEEYGDEESVWARGMARDEEGVNEELVGEMGAAAIPTRRFSFSSESQQPEIDLAEPSLDEERMRPVIVDQPHPRVWEMLNSEKARESTSIEGEAADKGKGKGKEKERMPSEFEKSFYNTQARYLQAFEREQAGVN